VRAEQPHFLLIQEDEVRTYYSTFLRFLKYRQKVISQLNNSQGEDELSGTFILGQRTQESSLKEEGASPRPEEVATCTSLNCLWHRLKCANDVNKRMHILPLNCSIFILNLRKVFVIPHVLSDFYGHLA
jgi:hypothetical protein